MSGSSKISTLGNNFNKLTPSRPLQVGDDYYVDKREVKNWLKTKNYMEVDIYQLRLEVDMVGLIYIYIYINNDLNEYVRKIHFNSYLLLIHYDFIY